MRHQDMPIRLIVLWFMFITWCSTIIADSGSQNRRPVDWPEVSCLSAVSSPDKDIYFGTSLSPGGDINNDGYADVLIGAACYRKSMSSPGAVFVAYGKGAGTLKTDILCGDTDKERFGSSMASAGDLNGDGYNDVIIGAPFYSGGKRCEGRVCIYYGSQSGLNAMPDVVLSCGEEEAQFGRSVDGAGDFNGDGYDDVVIGSPGCVTAHGKCGRVFIYLGSKDGIGRQPAWILEGDNKESRFGWSVAMAKDINGDGLSDVVAGAPGYSVSPDLGWLTESGLADLPVDTALSHEGQVVIFFGARSQNANIDTHNINGNAPYAFFGESVKSCGDLNGDGKTDVVISTKYGRDGNYRGGQLFVIYGDAISSNLSAGRLFESEQEWSAGNNFFSSAGDLNLDGFDDLIVGYAFYDNGRNDEGRVNIYLGGEKGLHNIPSLAVDGNAADAWLGLSVSGAGDVNGDGAPEVVVSAAFFTNHYENAKTMIWSGLRNLKTTDVSIRNESFKFYVKDQRKMLLDAYDKIMGVSDGVIRCDEKSMQYLRNQISKILYCADDYEDCQRATGIAYQIGYRFLHKGDLESAVRYLEMSDDFALVEWLFAPENKKIEAMYNVINRIQTLGYTLGQQGKPAVRRYYRVNMTAWHNSILQCGQKAVKRPLYHRRMLHTERSYASELELDGEYTKAQERLQSVIKQAEEHNFRTDIGRASIDLASIMVSLELYDDAEKYARKRLAAPIDQSIPGLDWYQYVQAYEIIARKNGVTDEIMNGLEDNLKKLKKLDSQIQVLNVILIKARLLFWKDESKTALQILDDLIKASTQNEHTLIKAKAMELRAEINLTLNNLKAVENDCMNALEIFRRLGYKEKELQLYEFYALSKSKQGKFAIAIKVFESAFDMAISLNLPHKALRMLLHILQIHIDLENFAEVRRLLMRIEAFIAKHPSIPKPTWTLYLEMRDSALAFLDRHDDVSVDVTSVNEGIDSAPEQDSTLETGDSDRDSSGVTNSLIIKPDVVLTSVRSNEFARARFVLYNPSLSNLAGEISVQGLGAVKWEKDEFAWRGEVVLNETNLQYSLSVDVAPSSASVVFLERLVQADDTDMEMTLEWSGESDVSSKWRYMIDNNPQTTQVINSYYEEENPFYHTTFYHEIYYRGNENVYKNIKAEASELYRIEFIESESGKLLAIDANADGDFEDSGDVIRQDFDNNGYPDVEFNASQDAVAVELLVYPVLEERSTADEIKIDVYLEDDHEWQYQATDILKLL